MSVGRSPAPPHGRRQTLVTIGLLLLFLTGVAIYAASKHAAEVSAEERSFARERGIGGGTSSVNTQGAASFIGKASNAVMFIQWTRAGQTVTGSLREAITKINSLGLNTTDRSITGVVDGNGITLNAHGELGENTSYVGETKENGFTLTVPGEHSSLININFAPSDDASYGNATKQLILSSIPSPCSLYVTNHEVHVSFHGQDSAEDCANFIQGAGNTETEWTTVPQEGVAYGSVVCELANNANEKAIITDGGGQVYGKEACAQLSSEGWG